MKLREIDKSEVFDLIKQGKSIYLAGYIDPCRMSLQGIADAEAVYVEADPSDTQADSKAPQETPQEAEE